MPVTEYFGHIRDTVKSAWEGMSVTLSYLFRRPMTVQYAGPEDAKARGELVQHTLPSRYRGLLEVDMDTCTACLACERACPINVIAIEVERDPANPKLRVMTRFDIDASKCMHCGLCVEPCPTGSIVHTREFEGAQQSLNNLVLRFVDPTKPAQPYKPPKGATAYPRVVLGEVTRKLLAQWDTPPPVLPRYGPDSPPTRSGSSSAKGTPGTLGPSDEVARALAAQAVSAEGRTLTELIRKAQAGVDCGACGYPTCALYADAVVRGETGPNHCEPGGDPSARATRFILESAAKKQRVLSPEALKARYAPPGPKRSE